MAEFISERALGVAMKIAPEGRYTDTVTTTGYISSEVTTKLQAGSPVFTMQARSQLMRFDSATPVPLQRGSWTQQGVTGLRLASVEKSGEELLVNFIRHSPSSFVDLFGGRYYPGSVNREFNQYVLVNGAHDFVDRGRFVDRRSTRIGTVDIDWYTMSYRASKKAGGQRPLLEAINALNDAELKKVTFVEQARFSHEITADPFKVEMANP